ncbi:MAG TPA: CAP domain-containing protein, partial [Candidatus Binataceae bacterium]|nr:CAP domain-containing protein [Candidatus Binataceae bacterium]
PVAPRERWKRAKAVSAIAAFAAIALAAFVIVRQMLPRDEPRQKAGAGSGAVAPLPAPASNPSAPEVVMEAPKAITAVGAPIAPTAPPTPSVSAAQLAAAQPWLTRLNYYRGLAGLAAVAPDPALEAGDIAHARYLVKNDGANMKTGAIGAEAHTEDASNPWYSHEGLIAAQASDVEEGFQPNESAWISPAIAIDGWISIPFHRLAILNPGLHSAGYGQYCEDGYCAAAMNLLTDRDEAPSLPQILPKPIMFPPDGSTLPLKSWQGEWPNPLTSCPGYTGPSGLAITLQLGLTLVARLKDYKVTSDGGARSAIETCGFDSTTYVNPDPVAQHSARRILTNLGAVVIVPREPLEPGHYTVTLTANDRPYAWSFTIR